MDTSQLHSTFVVLLALFKLSSASGSGCYTTTPAPARSCIEKYQVIPDHIYCQMDVARLSKDQLNYAEIDEIENKHNTIRTLVNPPAGDMLLMAYSVGLQRPAQIWTQQCSSREFTQHQRFLPGMSFIGLNTLISTKNSSWNEVIDAWLKENSSFVYNSTGNNPQHISNYTQMIWSKTSVVGCAKHECSGSFHYACAYAPGIDASKINEPYNATSRSCLQCSTSCNNTLCGCSGILCLNGGEVDLTTCNCKCPSNGNLYTRAFCDMYCIPGGDDSKCGSVYTKASCTTSQETIIKCPWMCDICPYASKNYTFGSAPLPWQRGRSECTTAATTVIGSTLQQTGGNGCDIMSHNYLVVFLVVCFAMIPLFD